MSSHRIVFVLFVILICMAHGRATNIAAAPAQGAVSPAAGPPAFGTWEYTGRDDRGTTWTGTLTIEKVNPTLFDPKRYFALCEVEQRSPDPNTGTRSVQGPCEYDEKTREVSFRLLVSSLHSFSAVLSQDGQSLTNGKWTESKGTKVVRTVAWSAKLPAR